MMKKSEYDMLVEERNRLVMLMGQVKLVRHKVWIMKDLTAIRERISNAHRERNRKYSNGNG